MPVRRAWSNCACRSGASGVVCAPESVPISLVGIPEACMIAASRWVVVVLPLVPVIPTTVIARLGWPLMAAATGPIANRTSSTTSCGTSTPSS